MTFYLTFYSNILFWHLCWHSIWHTILTFQPRILYGILTGMHSEILLASILTFLVGSILAFYLTFCFSKKATWYMPYLMTLSLASVSGISSDILSGILPAISSKIFCGWGPAGNTLILSLLFGSGWDHFAPELVVEVRRGISWSRPAGTPSTLAYHFATPPYTLQLWVRGPLQPLQKSLQKSQPPFGPSVDSLCPPCITTAHLLYSFLSLKLPPPACAVLLLNASFTSPLLQAILMRTFRIWSSTCTRCAFESCFCECQMVFWQGGLGGSDVAQGQAICARELQGARRQTCAEHFEGMQALLDLSRSCLRLGKWTCRNLKWTWHYGLVNK